MPRQHLGNVGWTLGAQIVALPLRLVRFVTLARLLGIEQYGLFIAVSAFVSFAAPFAGWGFGFLLARNVARDRTTFRHWWGNSLLALAVTAVPLTVVLSIVGVHVVPDSTVLLLLAVATADLLFTRVVDFAERAYRANWRMANASISVLIPEFARTVMLIPFFFVVSRTAAGWAAWQLFGVALSAVLIYTRTNRDLGMPIISFRSLRGNFIHGTHFAIGQFAGNIHTNIDRVMLSRLASLEVTGLYSAAWVVISMSFLPIMSLNNAVMARYFELGGKSVRRTVRFGWKNVAGGMVYAIVASTTLLVAAPIIPVLLGDDYVRAVEAIRWLALMPVFYVLTDVAGSILSAIDRPQDRTKVFICVAAANVLMNLWLIPRFSWQGAVLATVVAEVLLSAGLWGVIHYWQRREETQRMGEAPA